MSYNGVKVAHIVATDINGCIGKAGQMPWHVPADLKRFKELTKGGVVIMGRKTFESLGSRPLPDRVNIVVSKTKRWYSDGYDDVHVKSTINEALDVARNTSYLQGVDTIWIIGGGEIYYQTMPYVDVIEHTVINTEVMDGDTFYPDVREQFDAIDAVETTEATYYTLHRR